MKIKLSATFEGKCSICKKEKVVFTAGDEDTGKTVTVCRDCSNSLGDMKTSDVIEKYGTDDKKAFKEEGVSYSGKFPRAG